VNSEADTSAQARLMVCAAPREALGWLTARSGYTPMADAKGIMAVREGRILGMVVFDGFTETIAQAHVALDSPRAMAALVHPAFQYAFLQAGRIALVTFLDSRNTGAVRLVEGLGFREKGRCADGVALGGDLIFYEMRRERCRFLPRSH
jgi:RimJ/RimL family protein N-acetyltransferase